MWRCIYCLSLLSEPNLGRCSVLSIFCLFFQYLSIVPVALMPVIGLIANLVFFIQSRAELLYVGFTSLWVSLAWYFSPPRVPVGPFVAGRGQCGCRTKLGTWCIPVALVRAAVFITCATVLEWLFVCFFEHCICEEVAITFITLWTPRVDSVVG